MSALTRRSNANDLAGALLTATNLAAEYSYGLQGMRIYPYCLSAATAYRFLEPNLGACYERN
jgi:hypothetical protein